MSRQVARQIGRKIKKMNDSDAYQTINNAIMKHSQAVYEDLIESLRQEYGFADKRIERLEKRFDEIHAKRFADEQ